MTAGTRWVPQRVGRVALSAYHLAHRVDAKPPENITQLDAQAKLTATICNLFVNHRLPLADVVRVLHENYSHTVSALIDQGGLRIVERHHASGIILRSLKLSLGRYESAEPGRETKTGMRTNFRHPCFTLLAAFLLNQTALFRTRTEARTASLWARLWC